MSIPPTTPASPEQAGRISKTLAYYAVFIAFGLAGTLIGPTLPDLAEKTQTELGQISFLFTAFSLGRLFGAWQVGRFYDRLPGHPVMAVMLALMALMVILVPLIPLLWLLMIVFLLIGLAEGALDVGGNTLIVWVHRHQVGPFMNGLHFAFGVGAFLTPIIIAQAVLISGDITWAFWVVGLFMIPVIIWLLRLPNPVAQAVSERDSSRQTGHLLVPLIALFFFLYVGAEVSFGGWIFTYAMTLDLADETMGRYLTSAFFGALTVGRLLAIPIAVRFRPRTILMGDFVGCLISLSLILLWPDSLIVLWMGTLGLGLAMASVFPTILSFAERRMTITGRITGWFLVGGSAGAMVLPWLIGQLFEMIGPGATMVTILIDLLATIIVFVGLILYSTYMMPDEDIAGYA